MDFERTYNNTSEQTKLKFLDAIIRHNDKLQNEFVAYAGKITEIIDRFSYSEFTKIAGYIQATYQARFEEVDTENPDWDNYHPPHSGYIDYHEAYQYASEQEFEAIMEGFVKRAIDKIIEQNPGELLAMFTGLYEGTQNAVVEDEVCSFDNVNEYLLGLLSDAVLMVVEKIRLSALSDKETGKAFEIFFQYCNNEYPGNPYFAGHFEPLLLAYAEKSENPSHLLEIFKGAGIDQSTLPELTLYLNKASGNMDNWLQSALQLYKNSQAVAKELLQFYFDTDKTAFLTLSRELFDANGTAWVDFLKGYLSPELDKELFVSLHLKYVAKSLKISDYLIVQKYLSKADVDNLLTEVGWNSDFKAKILAVEQRFAEIKQMIETSVSKWDFANVIQPILNVYPDFCFRQLKDMATGTLQTERGRDVYELIALWLKLAQKIPGFEADTHMLIQQTYTHKPNLPALKDEMRKAGLVK